MEMCIFIRIRFYCMNCIVIYNMFLMYINLVYFYFVCKIKNKIFDVGLVIFFWQGEYNIVQQKYVIKLYYYI